MRKPSKHRSQTQLRLDRLREFGYDPRRMSPRERSTILPHGDIIASPGDVKEAESLPGCAELADQGQEIMATHLRKLESQGLE